MDSRKFFYDFGKLIYNIDAFYTNYAKKYNVKENELWILYALNDGKEHSQIEICENWDIPKTTVNTIVKELENKNIIKLVKINNEKRKMYIKLTNYGSEYAENLLAEIYNLEKNIYDNLSFNQEKLIEYLNELKNKYN